MKISFIFNTYGSFNSSVDSMRKEILSCGKKEGKEKK